MFLRDEDKTYNTDWVITSEMVKGFKQSYHKIEKSYKELKDLFYRYGLDYDTVIDAHRRGFITEEKVKEYIEKLKNREEKKDG